VALVGEKGEVGEVLQGSVVLGKVNTRLGVGRRGLAPKRSSRPRKAIGDRGVKSELARGGVEVEGMLLLRTTAA
jgi:hypothetical protein